MTASLQTPTVALSAMGDDLGITSKIRMVVASKSKGKSGGATI